MAELAAYWAGRQARGQGLPVLHCPAAAHRQMACWIEGWLAAHHVSAEAGEINDLRLFPVQRDGAIWQPAEFLFLEPARRDGLSSAGIGRLLGRGERSIRVQACRLKLPGHDDRRRKHAA
ncbi:hypothetical protein EDC65_2266 [Stella humosa]|uniref:Uncharacterized protein n=1 Tax=Stella humosa TaxID=94 RepID=A0A3N1MCN3_9PROT|nr:hypothetical protein [Stella humosa]ROQ00467.1 hypothetical protein EDC65_2266 [Stella humosa]BBK30288.1 hypothetical protein STHU_09220 [Stella humosa]